MVLLKSHDFSIRFLVRPLIQADIPAILKLYETNPYYFEHCPPPPTEASILNDMTRCLREKEGKTSILLAISMEIDLLLYLIWLKDILVMRKLLLVSYMLDKAYQGRELGSQLIVELLGYVTRQFKTLRLGYVATNLPAKAFWEKQGFVQTGEKSQGKQYTIILAEYLKKDK